MTQPKYVYTLTAASYVEPPYMEECFPEHPENCPNPGIDVMFLVRVLNNVGIRVKLVAMDEESLLGSILNGSIDVLAQSENVKDNAYGDFCDATTLVSMERPAFYAKTSHDNANGFSLLTVFGWKIWFVALLCFGVGHCFGRIAEVARLGVGLSVSETKGHVVQSGKLTECLCFIVLSVLLNVYANVLAIGFANNVEISTTLFANTEELAQLWYDGKCRIMTYDYMIDEMRGVFPTKNHTKHSKLNEMLYEAAQKYPPIMVDADEYENFLGWIINNQSCLVHVDYETRRHTFKSIFGNKLSVVLDTEGPQENYVYFYSRLLNYTVKSLINLAFTAGSSVDNYDKTVEQLVALESDTANHTFAFDESSVSGGVQALKITQFWIPFAILFGLQPVAFCAIIAEYWMHGQKRATRKVISVGNDKITSRNNNVNEQMYSGYTYGIQ